MLNKSEILNKLGNFHASKQVLLKAYKLKSTNLEEHRIIEENLRSGTFEIHFPNNNRNT